MCKIKFAAYILVFICFFTFGSACADNQNNYVDLSDLTGWNIYKFIPDAKYAQEAIKYYYKPKNLQENIVMKDKENTYNGKTSILMEKKSDFGFPWIYRKIDLEEGAYLVSFYAKASLAQKSGCTVALAHERFTKEIDDTWKKYNFYFDIPYRTKDATIYIRGIPDDKLWLADIKLVKIPISIEKIEYFRKEFKNNAALALAAKEKFRTRLILNIKAPDGKIKKIKKYIDLAKGFNNINFNFPESTRGEYGISFELLDLAANKIIYKSKPVKYVIPKLMSLKLLKPGYRNSIYSTNPIKAIEAECNFVFVQECKEKYKLIVCLKNTDKKIIDKFETNLTAASDTKRIAFRFNADNLQEGQYEISADLVNNKGKVISKDKLECDKLTPAKDEVIIDSDGKIILNGKPTFPVGAYLWIPTQKNIKEFGFDMVEAQDSKDHCGIISGGKLILPDNYVYKKDFKDYLDDVSKLGIRVIIHKDVSDREDKEAMIKAVNGIIDKYKNSDFLGYAFYDEPEFRPNLWDNLDCIRKTAVSKDPYHPLYSCHYDWNSYEKFMPYVDIFGINPYTFGPAGRPVYSILDRFKRIEKILPLDKAIFYVPQSLACFPYFPVSPTPDELRCETYLALNQGAAGILFYSMIEIMDINSPPGCVWFLPESNLAEEVKILTKQIKELSPVLLSKEKNAIKLTGDNKCVNYRLYKHKEKHYLIAVNMFNEKQSMNFKIKQNGKKYKLYDCFTENEVVLKNNLWQDVFNNYQVKIYIIK